MYKNAWTQHWKYLRCFLVSPTQLDCQALVPHKKEWFIIMYLGFTLNTIRHQGFVYKELGYQTQIPVCLITASFQCLVSSKRPHSKISVCNFFWWGWDLSWTQWFTYHALKLLIMPVVVSIYTFLKENILFIFRKSA